MITRIIITPMLKMAIMQSCSSSNWCSWALTWIKKVIVHCTRNPNRQAKDTSAQTQPALRKRKRQWKASSKRYPLQMYPFLLSGNTMTMKATQPSPQIMSWLCLDYNCTFQLSKYNKKYQITHVYIETKKFLKKTQSSTSIIRKTIL